MAEDRSLPYGGPLPPSWLAALQEFIGTAAPNFHLSLADTHTVQVVAGVNSGQVGIGIDGLFRYNTVTATAAITGAAGLYDVFAVCGPNAFASNPTPPPPELDNTIYAFALQVLPNGTTPTLTGTVTNFRKVGNLDWNGTAVTDLRPLVGEVDGNVVTGTLPKHHAASHLVGGTDELLGIDDLQLASPNNDRWRLLLQATATVPPGSNGLYLMSSTGALISDNGFVGSPPTTWCGALPALAVPGKATKGKIVMQAQTNNIGPGATLDVRAGLLAIESTAGGAGAITYHFGPGDIIADSGSLALIANEGAFQEGAPFDLPSGAYYAPFIKLGAATAAGSVIAVTMQMWGYNI